MYLEILIMDSNLRFSTNYLNSWKITSLMCEMKNLILVSSGVLVFMIKEDS